MKLGIWICLAAVGFFMIVGVLSGEGDGTAMSCLTTKDEHGSKRFGNSCSYPVEIRVCRKHKVSAIGELFGSQSNWQCEQRLTQPKRYSISIGWNSGILSNANYVVGVCRSGYNVGVDVNSRQLTCSK